LAAASFEAFFLPRNDGYRFAVLHKPSPALQARGTILYVHPFADEMNLSRRTVAHAARGLAEDGWIVLLLDLLGCGDSSGEFGEASWEAWVDDVCFTFTWLQRQHRAMPVLWGIRAGCLLITEAVHRLSLQAHLMLWQPVSSGRLFLGQFLRLKTAADMLAERTERTGIKVLREQLAQGAELEVGGYALSPELALPLEAAELNIPNGHTGNVIWCEVSASEGSKNLSPAAEARVQSWRQSGIQITPCVVGGPLFWQMQEITENQQLTNVSRALMQTLSQ
jgi:exosortase A-associated hydrolase 2